VTIPNPLTSVKIAIVDDDCHVRASYVELLTAVGCKVVAYATGGDFLQHVQDDAPQCIILDLRLPDMSGLDVQAELSARRIDVPLIFVSGAARPQEIRKALAQGAVALLDKPVDVQLLMERVRQAVLPQP
jgi:FixJ family two-component response regulator